MHIDWFDPNNSIGSTKTPSVTNNKAGSIRDNHGTILSLAPKTLTFNQNNVVHRIAKLNIGNAHAGDNYIIAAHPNSGVLQEAVIDPSSNISVPVETQGSGGSPSGGSGGAQAIPLDKSPTLTVWRTLWTERDQVTVPPAYPEAGLPLINGVVATELARACVDVKEYLPNQNVNVVGEFFRPAWSTDVKNQYSAASNSFEPSNTFWTVLMIGAFKHVNGYWGSFNENMAFVYNSQIDSDFQDQGERVSARQVVALHELGHAFGLDDIEENDTSNPGYETVMMICDVDDLLEYQSFSVSQLQTIQSQQKPQ